MVFGYAKTAHGQGCGSDLSAASFHEYIVMKPGLGLIYHMEDI